MHELDGAYERTRRARNHLTNLKRRIKAFTQVMRDDVFIERKPAIIRLPDGTEVAGVLGTATSTIRPVPLIISILVGETIYNLRAALDYLVYELARHDAERIIDGTQFPIERREEGFKGRRTTWLKGINDEHVTAIERLQPYKGCDWSSLLRDLSNPDKHRHLTAVENPVVISPSPGSTEAIIAGQTVDVKDDVSVSIVLGDGTPVVEALQQLQSEITQVLDAFKPEFER